MVVTRFCPTPNGYLHHGHAYVALLNQGFARRHQGRFYVQIDDYFERFPDETIVQSIIDDLDWLGICPKEQVRRHRDNKPAYLELLDKLAGQGKVRIRRLPKGCCITKVEIQRNGSKIPVVDVQATSCDKSVLGYLPYASHPRHTIDPNWTAIIREAACWRHDTAWASDPADPAPWIEFKLPQDSRPDSVSFICWHPKPNQVTVEVRTNDGRWQEAGAAGIKQERLGDIRWAAFNPPLEQEAEVVTLSPTVVGKGVAALRLVFTGGQYSESYELCKPAAPEILPYRDLILGDYMTKRTQAMGFEIWQFARSASDLLLGATHVIRGDELEGELDGYLTFLQALEFPCPVLCHVPHLVDNAGEKLAKSLGNAPRIVDWFKQLGFTPGRARQWVIENAYTNVKDPTPLHSFEAQLKLLSATVTQAQQPRPAAAAFGVQSASEYLTRRNQL